VSGFVYFVTPEAVFHRSEEDLHVVKIGYTRFHPRVRMRELQCGSPVTLELLAYIDGSIPLERAFHDTFAELRWQGEWFLLDRKLRDFLGYFNGLPPSDRYVPREQLLVSLYDNVFAPTSSHPQWTDEEYQASAEDGFLRVWFPEAMDA
jgi:hypothetical protein